MRRKDDSKKSVILDFIGEGEEETEEVIEYIRLPESLVSTGEFFVIIAKGDQWSPLRITNLIRRKQIDSPDRCLSGFCYFVR